MQENLQIRSCKYLIEEIKAKLFPMIFEKKWTLRSNLDIINNESSRGCLFSDEIQIFHNIGEP